MPDAIILENCIRVHAKVSLEELALMAMISTRDKFPDWLPLQHENSHVPRANEVVAVSLCL